MAVFMESSLLTMVEQLIIQKKLAEKLSEIKLKNPSYSIRAFSKKTGVSSSALSEILNGKRKVSVKIVKRISDRLCFSPKETKVLLNLFPKNKLKESKNAAYAKEFIQLGMDQFHVISDWYHFALLSLSETSGYKDDPMWLAHRLGVSSKKIKMALERLQRLNMMRRDRQGILRASGEEFSTTDGVSSVSIRKSHSQNLELAQRSLDHDELAMRDFTAMTMAIDPEKLGEARKMIREFRDKLCTYLESGTKKEIYKLCVQLFPLSHQEKSL